MISTLDFNRHPCFNAAVKGRYGRVHLPVAPKCNIKCNYCNRKYDCVNESRPGVTSTVLTPNQALSYLDKVLAKEPRITVAGIAGPGDPFADPDRTLETMRLIRKKYPGAILCLASNGLRVAPYVDELAEIGVSHVTVTVNAVDPRIGEKIYAWVRDGRVVYRGRKAAGLLLTRQLHAIAVLKKHGITVKVNTIVIPGINDRHIMDVAAKMKELRVDLLNCMAMFPSAGTVFAEVPEPSAEMMGSIRKEAERYLPQMRHCTRCRADAVGLLDSDRTGEMRGCLAASASTPEVAESARPFVAVATLEGMLVNLHLGEADFFQIWGEDGAGGYRLVEVRQVPGQGGGPRRWMCLARLLSDCRAVLVNDLGEGPWKILTGKGVRPVPMAGFIEQGLEAVYSGKGLHTLLGRVRKCSTKGACAGAGSGCG